MWAIRPHTEQEGEPLRKNSRFLIVGVALTVLAGGVYLYTAASPLLSRLIIDPPALTAPIAFEQYHHTDDLELMLTREYRGSPVKQLRLVLKYSGATLEGKHVHATTTTYTYRKPMGVRTWMIWIDADSNGKIVNISVDEA